jgi:vacuolar-type H+-ATPase subunit E/Vma4
MKKQEANFNYSDYLENVNEEKNKIIEKIRSIEQKLISLNNKETILNNIIMKVSSELDNIDPKHFKAVSQIRTTLSKQLESLSLIEDMIIKFEDMILKYRKMLIDIENQKMNHSIKFNSDIPDDTDLSKVLLQINNQFNEIKNSTNPLLESAKKELEKDGFI